METIKKVSYFVALQVVAISVLVTRVYAAGTFALLPSNGTITQGCESSLSILESISSGSSNAADIQISYDPNKVEIIDALPAFPGVQIMPGNAYATYAGNTVDTTNGIIKLVGYSTNDTLQNTATFATINFTTKPGATSADFTIYFIGANPYNSLDSNIADATTSYDMLSGVTNASYHVVQGSCSADTTAPTITFVSPKNFDKNVAPNAPVSFTVTDAGSGINLATFSASINGTTYTSTSAGVSVSGSPAQYTITIAPQIPFPQNAESSVTVVVSDNAGNSHQENLVFNTAFACPTAKPQIVYRSCTNTTTVTTPTPTPTPTPSVDQQAPQITFTAPSAGSTLQNPATITLTATDNVGLSIESFKLIAGKDTYSLTSTPAQIAASGSARSYIITVTLTSDTVAKLPEQFSIQALISDISGNTRTESLTLRTLPKNNQQHNAAISLGTISFITVTVLTVFALLYFLFPRGQLFLVIKDRKTQKPIPFAYIVATDTVGKTHIFHSTITGSVHGTLPLGTWLLTIQKYGYRTATLPIEKQAHTPVSPHEVLLENMRNNS